MLELHLLVCFRKLFCSKNIPDRVILQKYLKILIRSKLPMPAIVKNTLILFNIIKSFSYFQLFLIPTSPYKGLFSFLLIQCRRFPNATQNFVLQPYRGIFRTARIFEHCKKITSGNNSFRPLFYLCENLSTHLAGHL